MSWKQLSIDGKTFLSKCTVENNSLVKFFLSDFEYLWKEECPVEEILQRARERNKRIEYDNETILSTLVSLPSHVSLHSLESKADLDYKYYISNRPFNFKWQLDRCNQQKYVETMLQPLLLSASTLAKQNAELLDIIRKKDLEIEQYKLEGATLKRYKLITNKFDPEEYEKNIRYKPVPEFLAYADDQFDNLIKLHGDSSNEKNNLLNTPQKKADISNTNKLSPRSKKNSGYRTHIQKIQQKLDMPTQKFYFDDSDSSTSPTMSESEMENSRKKLELDTLNATSSSYSNDTKKLKLCRKSLDL